MIIDFWVKKYDVSDNYTKEANDIQITQELFTVDDGYFSKGRKISKGKYYYIGSNYNQ